MPQHSSQRRAGCRCEGTGRVSVSQMVLAEFGNDYYKNIGPHNDGTTAIMCPACVHGDAIRASKKGPHMSKQMSERILFADNDHGFGFRIRQAANMSDDRREELKREIKGTLETLGRIPS